MGLCFVSRTLGLQRIDGCCSQPVQARKNKQEWQKSGSNNGGKAKQTGRGGNRRAGHKPGSRSIGEISPLGLIYGFTQTNPRRPMATLKGVTGEGLRGGG